MKIFGRKKHIITEDQVMHSQNEAVMESDLQYVKDKNSVDIPYIVTAEKQKRLLMKKKPDAGVTLFDIISDEKLLAKFDKYEFPALKIMDSGEVFFQPICRIISPVHTHFVKWFSLTKNLEFSHDHSYEFAKLNLDGYLMKVKLSTQINKVSGVEIMYVCDVNDIEIKTIIAPRTTGARIEDAADSTIPVEQYAIAQFNPYQYQKIAGYVNHLDEFINIYLQDISEELGPDDDDYMY